MKKTLLLNAQWQGGGDLGACHGARDLVRRSGAPFLEVPVSTEPVTSEVHGILGYEVLREQMAAAGALLRQEAPDKLFTVGGSCDGDIPSILWLNEMYGGDLTVIWMDAHGDCNAPWESESHLLYGMPLRFLLGEGGEALAESITPPLRPAQLIHLCGRDFDPPEAAYFEKAGITVLPEEPGETLIRRLDEALGAKGNAHVYLHLDLDVLDSVTFPATPLPVPDGLPEGRLWDVLDLLKTYPLVGMGLYEYKPDGRDYPLLQRLMEFGSNI